MGYCEMFKDLMKSGKYTKGQLTGKLNRIKAFPNVMDQIEYDEIMAALDYYYGEA